jgi:diacylglycerol kinase (ATP)
MIDWRHRGLSLTWDDGTTTTGRFASVELALGKYTGGGMRLVADVDLSDGLFDVLMIGEPSRLEFLTFSWRVRTADHLRSPRCSTRRTASLRAEATDGRGPVYLQADGELLGRDPVTFTILPGALLVAG